MKSTVIVEKKSKGKSQTKSSRGQDLKSEAVESTVSNTSSTSIQMDDVALNDLLPTIKESLLFQKSQILNRTNEFKRSQQDSVQLSDEAEVASNDLSNNLSIHLHERSMKALFEIDKALNKIAQGTYGECESCGDTIHPKRLQARPLAPLCISCMEEREEEIRIKHQ